MNKYVQHYFHSFRQRNIIMPFFIDIVFWLIIFLLLLGFRSLLQKRTTALGLFSPEQLQQQLQQLLLTSPEQAQALAASLKYLVITIIGGSIVFLILFLLLYSLSRALIWNRILGQKLHTRNYWKWNILSLVLVLPALLYLFIASIVKMVLGYFFTSISNPNLQQFANNLALFIFLLLFLLFIFLAYYSFAERYKVWESVGRAFHLLKIHWSKLWEMFVVVLGTAIVLNLLLLGIQRLFFPTIYAQKYFIFLSLIVFLLFLSWLRLYLLRTIHHEPASPPAQ